MNSTVTTLTSRNADFAQRSFVPGASMMPSLQTIVIGCADPRVVQPRDRGMIQLRQRTLLAGEMFAPRGRKPSIAQNFDRDPTA